MSWSLQSNYAKATKQNTKKKPKKPKPITNSSSSYTIRKKPLFPHNLLKQKEINYSLILPADNTDWVGFFFFHAPGNIVICQNTVIPRTIQIQAKEITKIITHPELAGLELSKKFSILRSEKHKTKAFYHQ